MSTLAAFAVTIWKNIGIVGEVFCESTGALYRRAAARYTCIVSDDRTRKD